MSHPHRLVTGCAKPNPAGSASHTGAPPGPPPSQKRNPLRRSSETVILTDPSGNSEEVDLLRFVDAHRRMSEYHADLAAGRTDDLAPFAEFMSMKAQFARFFGGANILHAEVSEAANPLLRTKDILMLRCAVLALVLRDAAVQAGIHITQEIADYLKEEAR